MSKVLYQKFSLHRKFDNKIFDLYSTNRKKRILTAQAKRFRQGKGWLCRIVKERYKGRPLYLLYTRG